MSAEDIGLVVAILIGVLFVAVKESLKRERDAAINTAVDLEVRL